MADGTPTETIDVHPVLPWLTARRRAWLYRVAGALGLVLVAIGKVTQTDLVTWLGLAAALLGTGTAAAHTPTSAP